MRWGGGGGRKMGVSPPAERNGQVGSPACCVRRPILRPWLQKRRGGREGGLRGLPWGRPCGPQCPGPPGFLAKGGLQKTARPRRQGISLGAPPSLRRPRGHFPFPREKGSEKRSYQTLAGVGSKPDFCQKSGWKSCLPVCHCGGCAEHLPIGAGGTLAARGSAGAAPHLEF